MRTLYIRQIHPMQLALARNVPVSQIERAAGGHSFPVFVSCDEEGRIDMNATRQYSAVDLVERNNVKIVTPDGKKENYPYRSAN